MCRVALCRSMARGLLLSWFVISLLRFFFQAEDGIRYLYVTGVQTCALPIFVGNLSGPTAIAAIGHLLADKGETLSAFYVSNVEHYLEQEGSYQRFISNLGRLPHTNQSVIIRSIFNRGIGGSTSEVKSVEQLLAQSAVGR